MTVLQKAWLPINAFLTLSSMSFNSRSMSHFLYRSCMIAFRPTIFCRLGLTPKACIFTVTLFPFLFKRTTGVLNNSVHAGLPCSHGRDIHPSRVVLWSAVFAIAWRSPRLCVDCGETRSYDQLMTPAAAAYYRPPRDQTSAPAKALVIAIQHTMVFARFLRATVVPSACAYALSPSSLSFQEQVPNTRAVLHPYTCCAPKLVRNLCKTLLMGFLRHHFPASFRSRRHSASPSYL